MPNHRFDKKRVPLRLAVDRAREVELRLMPRLGADQHTHVCLVEAGQRESHAAPLTMQVGERVGQMSRAELLRVPVGREDQKARLVR